MKQTTRLSLYHNGGDFIQNIFEWELETPMYDDTLDFGNEKYTVVGRKDFYHFHPESHVHVVVLYLDRI